MKYTLVVISSIVLLTVACVKKSAEVNCYVCSTNDSVTSNIPLLANPHYHAYTGYDCQWTKAQKDFQILKNTKTDTLFFRNDTLQVEHWTMSCEIDY